MKQFILGAIATLTLLVFVLTAAHAQNKQPQASAEPTSQKEDDGQKVFEQNCSRCHNAPEGFSPRISGTVVRHMRMRANLSREDEQKLLRFFNP